MIFKYIPDSYNYDLLNELGITNSQFLNFQIKYRTDFETLLKRHINFADIDKYLSQFHIPVIEDDNYNFYHQFSTLGSKYLFVRNNYHIEKLSLNDLEYINECIDSNKNLSDQFILQTLEKVVFEEGDFVFMGSITKENQVPSKSIIFEFAYNQLKCKDVNELDNISKVFNKLKKEFTQNISHHLGIPVSILKYDFIPDVFKESNDNYKKY